MSRARLIEWGKNLLILVLALSALNLAGIDEFVGRVTANTQISQSGDSIVKRTEQVAKPMTVMLTSNENIHHGVKYSQQSLDEINSWLTASLGEALGSSTEAEEVSVKVWERALSDSGVFIDYGFGQSISAVAKWLGVEISSNVSLHTARQFCLSIEGEAVSLYYIRMIDGRPYRCSTALDSERLLEQIEKYSPNRAMYAFELGEEYAEIDSYYVVLDSIAPVAELAATNPLLSGENSALLGLFDMNALIANHFTEKDGTAVYVDGEQSLRVSTDGRLVYNDINAAESSVNQIGTANAIEIAYSLAMSLPGAEGWTLQMSDINYDRDTDLYKISFDYLYDGILVCYANRESAMQFIVNGRGDITAADILCRNYSAAATYYPAPEEQALALISDLGGGEPMLAYADSGGVVSVKWLIKE